MANLLGQNLGINISRPQQALPFTKTRILTYHWSKSDESFRSNSNYRKFQKGGRRPSWVFNFTNVSVELPFRGWTPHAKFGANRTNRLEVIQILVFSRWRWAAILDFCIYDFWTVMLAADSKAKPHIKFDVNQTNRSDVSHFLIFIYFKMAGGGHLGFSIWLFSRKFGCGGRRPEHAYQIWRKSD